ncbi:alanine--tRNA ligase [Sporosalibacterium faouarense]|uniref:alanine--tRNA ligase n=1 Tax=Sporosalibacterium faouarense TaxID=516123 RepID=UPI00141D074E|nr:alanine--tRNA ligase [Sporosalibacterium faouarense]MTI48973.1 alanine--tRNA ligase [Bacillota bacterium]
MKKLGLHEIREEFLNFFKEKDHLVTSSFSLVPKNDKSLLLINAGMAPLKPYFMGTEEPPKRRMANCQKCLRTGDIDNVGKTSRHGTFFEMLGNFSFGDYFKKEAIEWAWEFMTERMEVSPDILWASVYEEDDEAYDIWKDVIKMPEEKIVRLGKDDNFWELEVGPCGPCSEIYIDRGEEHGCDSEDCKPGCDDCERFVEVWNLVFSQYDKDEQGNYNTLPNPNIDTGMGIERMAVVSQQVNNIFEIEPIVSILKAVEEASNVKYGSNDKNDMSLRVITDHLRAMTFLVSDGILPSNEGRGYVLRRLIRRAARHGKLLGITDNFLYKLVPVVIDLWKGVYPETKEKQEQIQKIIRIEEEKFQETIDQGINILKDYIDIIKNEGKTELAGEKAFKLYDTYGFPLDLTKEILEEEGLTVDEESFNHEMEQQRERARKAREEGSNSVWNSSSYNLTNLNSTEFEGYESLTSSSRVVSIIKEDNKVDRLGEDEEGIVILDKTPFYAESGGQIGDKGIFINNFCEAKVTDTKKESGNIFLHFVSVNKGQIKVGDTIETIVDRKQRINTARNHSVTHILHKALKEVLGEHVNQAGSLVMPERLRFDFTHFEALKEDELRVVEEKVNTVILEGLDVKTIETSLEEAKKLGAEALFDEKYGSNVRVVMVGEYSKELCGGTHIKNSSNIGLFKIISESGIASGVRRIEAITGEYVYEYMNNMEEQINDVAGILKTNKNDLLNKAQSITEETKSLEKEIDKLKSKLAMTQLDDIVNDIRDVDGVNVISKVVEGMDANGLRQLGDKIKDSMDSILLVLGTVSNGKVNLVAMCTKDLVSKGIHSGKIIKEVSKITGGGGGGRPDMAQAGGKDPGKLEEALNKVENLVKEQMK